MITCTVLGRCGVIIAMKPGAAPQRRSPRSAKRRVAISAIRWPTITAAVGAQDPIDPGHNRRARVVGAEVITARHRDIALLVAGCYFMEMLDGTNIIDP
jgi:hypothetical protein